jgi:hypothetical protein
MKDRGTAAPSVPSSYFTDFCDSIGHQETWEHPSGSRVNGVAWNERAAHETCRSLIAKGAAWGARGGRSITNNLIFCNALATRMPVR